MIAQKSNFQFLIGFLYIFMFVNSFIICPIIFHLFVIPKIEKRIGHKLVYKQFIYKWQIFAKWFVPPTDIGMYITILYIRWKTTGKKVILRWERDTVNAYALAQTNYDISKASFLEIVASFLAMLNMLIFIFLAIATLLFIKNS